MLIVIAIIAVLASLLIGGISKIQQRSKRSVASSEINAIRAALAMYESDQGSFPRRQKRVDPDIWNDDCAALYAALRNRSSQKAGGGPNTPYLDWKPERIGILLDGVQDILPGKMGEDGTKERARPIDKTETEQLNTVKFQETDHPPSANQPLVLLDPWGNPYHYREWASVRTSTKESFMTGGSNGPKVRKNFIAHPTAGGDEPIPTSGTGGVNDFPHNPEGYDIWSDGPNMVNEYGEGDDVASWSDGRD